MSWINVTLFVVAGLAAGAVGRRLLLRLRRGARVPPGWCEIAGATLFAVVALRWMSGGVPAWWLPVPLALTVIAVPLVAVDLARRRLPDALTLPGYAVLGAALGMAAALAGDGRMLVAAVSGSVLFLCAHVVVYAIAPRSLGAGDVKLAGSLGGVLGAVGWPALAMAACLASVLTLALALVDRLRPRAVWASGVPHGPGLLAATWLVAVFPGSGLGVA